MAREPFTWRGTIGPGRFAAWGFGLFTLKFAIDSWVSRLAFDRAFSPLRYVFPGSDLASGTTEASSWALTLTAISVPFLLAGLALTMRRLRSLDWSPWVALLFVVPFVNVMLFALLSVLAERAPRAEPAGVSAAVATPPRGVLAAALTSLGIWALLASPIAALSVLAFQLYGFSLFMVLPLGLGFTTALCAGDRSLSSTLGLTALVTAAVLLGLLVLALEGALCVAMSAPLVFAGTLSGAAIGYAVVQRRARRQPPKPRIRAFGGLALAFPLGLGLERAAALEPDVVAVVSSIDIDAPREVVWEHVIRFAPIDAPPEFPFSAGIAYPLRAEIRGEGARAVRECVFSTGSFVEPIEVWDAPRLLRFGVTSCPPTMEEWTLWDGIHPPHLEGNFVAVRGEFALEELDGGRTRLVGTTWYRQALWPQAYWRLWADWIVHRIHVRVLRHIAREAARG